MGCGTSFAKILLIIFNIIFWLSGAALLGVGIWLLVDPTILKGLDLLTLVSGSGNLLKYAAYVFIGVGAFVLIVGFFGCCGAIKENRCMLGVYIFLLVLIMGLEITGGVLAIIYKDKIEETITDKLKETFDRDYNKTSADAKAFTEALNVIQVQLKCCGVSGPKDYPDRTLDYPPQCCVLTPAGKEKAVQSLKKDSTDVKDPVFCDAALAENKVNEYGYGKGCEPVFKEWVQMHAIILIGVGIGIACLELFGFIFAVCLCRSIQDDE